MDWQSLLSKISDSVIQNGDVLDEYKDVSSNWLGYEGVSDEEIRFHEERLNTSLPPSYKQFLKASSGFKQLDPFIWDVFPLSKIDWLKQFDPDLCEDYLTY